VRTEYVAPAAGTGHATKFGLIGPMPLYSVCVGAFLKTGQSKVSATEEPVVVAMIGGVADETAVMPLEPPDAARTFPVKVSPLPIDKVGWRVAIAVFMAAVVASGVKSLLMATPDRASVTAPLLVVAVMPVPPVTDVMPVLPPTAAPPHKS